MNHLQKDWRDIDFTAVAEPHDYHVEYRLYEIAGLDSEDGNPCWILSGSTCGEFVYDLEKASVFAHGSVKWDGCSNWHFDEQDHVMIHGCARHDLTNIGEALARCWDWTAELCPHWDEEVVTT